MAAVSFAVLSSIGFAQAPAVGNIAPDFTLPLLDGNGKKVTLSALYSEKPVFLNFFATWCPPCRAETPALESTWKKYKGRVEVLSVNLRESPAAVKKFIRKYGVTFPVAMDEGEVARTYRVRFIPTNLLIEKGGKIRWVASGAGDEEAFERLFSQVAGPMPKRREAQKNPAEAESAEDVPAKKQKKSFRERLFGGSPR